MRVVHPSARADYYEAARLFPRFNEHRGYVEKRKYIEAEMVRMVKDNTLYLTDILNQSQEVWQIAGSIILGQTYDHDGAQRYAVPAIEISRHTVKIESINGDPIKFLNDHVPGEPIKKGSANSESPLYRVAEEWIEYDIGENELPLMHAWKCLRQYGEFCCPAKREEIKNKKWRYREVKPVGLTAPTATPPDTKTTETRRASRQTFAEANG
jgi:hypothetical protein